MTGARHRRPQDASSVRWDVFVSHSHADEAMAARIAGALRANGLRVFRAGDELDAFSSISETVLRALADSGFLLAYYSFDYATRPACQHEFATAYLAGQAEGDPLGRVVAINPERGFSHIEPRQLRDALLPARPASTAGLSAMADAIAAKAATSTGRIGTTRRKRVRWITGQPVHPPNEFVGRWPQLWWLHSALHPHVSPLTQQPTAPIAVVHGTVGIGKTSLAAEYVRRFGTAFPDGIVWGTPDAPPPPSHGDDNGHRLWVLDDAIGSPADIRRLLPSTSDCPCLVLTRDPRLATLGHSLELTDLSTPDTQQLISRHLKDQHSADATTSITTVTAGSPHTCARLAKLAHTHGIDAALQQVHRRTATVLGPLARRLAPALAGIGERGWDVLRILAAASPTTVAIPRLADILAGAHHTDRLTEITPVQRTVLDLLGRGLLPGSPDAVDLTLPNALRLAIQHLDDNPARAEQLRALTMHAIARTPGTDTPTRSRPAYDDEEQQAAHRIQTELVNRITGHPLPPEEGSLREALNSLHTLLTITRHTQATLHPAAVRASTSTRPGFGTLADRLINDILRHTLTHWHNALSAHEDQRPPHTSRIDHERDWPQHDQLRHELNTLHHNALEIATELSLITGNPLGLPPH